MCQGWALPIVAGRTTHVHSTSHSTSRLSYAGELDLYGATHIGRFANDCLLSVTYFKFINTQGCKNKQERSDNRALKCNKQRETIRRTEIWKPMQYINLVTLQVNLNIYYKFKYNTMHFDYKDKTVMVV